MIKNAETLGYNTVKAVRKSTTEVVKRKIVTEKEVEDSQDLGETKLEQVLNEPDNATHEACCQTTVQAVNTEHRETGDTKGQEQVLEEHDTSAACCQERNKIVSENESSEEETTETEQAVEEIDNAAPEINVSHELLEAINKLIRLFSFQEVKAALKLAER